MPMSVLVIDDSASIRQLVSFALKSAEYTIFEAKNGIEALAGLAEKKIDMVITDLNMPEMDGLELIKRIRAMPGPKYIPIIMLTTESQEDKKQEGKKAGASGWIIKPFTSEQLLAVVKRFLKDSPASSG